MTADPLEIDNMIGNLPRHPDGGRSLGRYRLINLAGNGGYGAVYEAVDEQLSRRVAIKILYPHLRLTNPTAVQRFLNEAQSAANVQHPNVCEIYDVGEIGGLNFMVMEYVDGVSVADILDVQNPLPPDIGLYLMEEAAKGLQAVHEALIIHRDVKPDNIMVTRSGQVKVGDLGLAKDLAADDDNLTQTGMVVGTPRFVSPEQAAGSRQLDLRTDIYSLGATAWRWFAGRSPFEGPVVELLHQIVNRDAPSLMDAGADVPDSVSVLVEMMMRRNYRRRPKSMKEVVQRIQEIRNVAGLEVGIPGPEVWSELVRKAMERRDLRTSSRRNAPLLPSPTGVVHRDRVGSAEGTGKARFGAGSQVVNSPQSSVDHFGTTKIGAGAPHSNIAFRSSVILPPQREIHVRRRPSIASGILRVSGVVIVAVLALAAGWLSRNGWPSTVRARERVDVTGTSNSESRHPGTPPKATAAHPMTVPATSSTRARRSDPKSPEKIHTEPFTKLLRLPGNIRKAGDDWVNRAENRLMRMARKADWFIPPSEIRLSLDHHFLTFSGIGPVSYCPGADTATLRNLPAAVRGFEKQLEAEQARFSSQPAVSLERFYVGRTEISVEEYREYLNATGAGSDAIPAVWNPSKENLRLPVRGVSRAQARKFAAWADGKFKSAFPDLARRGYSVQLPDAYEWEAVARMDARGTIADGFPEYAFQKDGRSEINVLERVAARIFESYQDYCLFRMRREIFGEDPDFPNGLLDVDEGAIGFHGIRNLLGNVREWTDGTRGNLRGGSWRLPAIFAFPARPSAEIAPGAAPKDAGIRLVISRRKN